MGRAQNQTITRQGDPFANVMPGRRGIKDEGLLAQVPTHHDRAQLASLVEEVREGQFQHAMQTLQKHSNQDAPLLRELYEETVEGLVFSQGVNKMRAKVGDTFFNVFGQKARDEHVRVASTYLTILGVQREYEGEACVVDMEKNRRLEFLHPDVHLRTDAQALPLCYQEAGPTPSRSPLMGVVPAYVMKPVPYVIWRRALVQTGKKKEEETVCETCLARAQKVETLREEPAAWHNERRDAAALEDIRVRTDVALRERLRSPAPITGATGPNIAAKQYKSGVLAQAAHILRTDRSAFEELCFTPHQKEWIERLQAGTSCSLPEVLSEKQWLEILVRDFPSSMEMVFTSGVVHHRHGDAALFAIERTLKAQDESLKIAA